jgi:hypothetical protein
MSSDRQHAVLSPSGASRWLNCTPSARLEMKFPDRAGKAADEGTLAHSLGETILRHKLKLIDFKTLMAKTKEINENDLYDAAMSDHAEDYAVFVMERYAEALSHTRDAIIFLEHRLNLTDIIPEGFGTGDAVIIANKVLDLIDLKYGKGVMVSAENNRQLMLYGLGALREFDHIYDIETVRMSIYQPRIGNYSTWEISVDELRKWADEFVKPRAALAFEGAGEFEPGAHCQFCKAKAVCKALADKNLELAQHEFKNPALLGDYEIAHILSQIPLFSTWVKAVQDHALIEAVQNGKNWPGYKVVEGRSVRKYSDEEAIAAKLKEAKYAEDIIFKKKLLNLTDMTKALGKKDFDTLVGPLLIKPPGKPALVPESDKRPAFNNLDAATVDFAEMAEEADA